MEVGGDGWEWIEGVRGGAGHKRDYILPPHRISATRSGASAYVIVLSHDLFNERDTLL